MSKKPTIKHYTMVYVGISLFAIVVVGLVFYNSHLGNNYIPVESQVIKVANPTYSQHVKVILDKRCTLCHKAGGMIGKTPLDSYQGVMKVTKSGDMESSLIKKTQQGGSMTQYLSKDEAEVLKTWVQQGANQ
jgi:hypothetical protein